MKVFEWIDLDGKGVVTDWGLQKPQRTKLDAKIDMLVEAEVDPASLKSNLPPGLLAGPGIDGQPFIYKLRVRGNIQLRPMVCLGPLNLNEWTILFPAIEVGNVLKPIDAAGKADERRKQILADKNRRRLLVDDDK
jgi:hypothetical protein